MFKVNCLLVYLTYFILQPTAADVDVPFIKKCKAEDEACLVSSAREVFSYFMAGIPALGIKSADPLVFNEINSDNAGLKLKLLNTKVIGLSKAVITGLKRDTKKQTIKLSLETPIALSGQYDLHGKILILEAFGQGNIEAHSDKFICTIEVKYDIIEKNGNKHWKITKIDYTYEYVEKLFIKLDNLFGGDKTLAEPLNKLFDESWKDVVVIASPVIDKIVHEICHYVNTFFLKVPTNKLEIQ